MGQRKGATSKNVKSFKNISAGAKHDFRRVTLGGVPKGSGKIPDFPSFEREECPLESVL